MARGCVTVPTCDCYETAAVGQIVIGHIVEVGDPQPVDVMIGDGLADGHPDGWWCVPVTLVTGKQVYVGWFPDEDGAREWHAFEFRTMTINPEVPRDDV